MTPVGQAVVVIGLAAATTLIAGCRNDPPKGLGLHEVSHGVAVGEADSMRVVGEETGGPAKEVKAALVKVLGDCALVDRAFLVKVDYGIDHNVACLLDFGSNSQEADLAEIVRKCSPVVQPIVEKAHISLDILSMSPQVRADLPTTVRPFYVRSERKP